MTATMVFHLTGPAAPAASWRRKVGEEVRTDGRRTVIDEIAEDEEEHGNGDQGTHAGHGQHEAAYELAPAETGAHACAVPLPRCEVATISRRARPLRMKVRRKSTRPSSMRDCK